MWEKFMTSPFVESSDFGYIGDQPTPWPCFIIAAKESAFNKMESFKKVLGLVKEECVRFKTGGETTIEALHTEFGIEKPLAEKWLGMVEFNTTDEALDAGKNLKPVSDVLFKLGRFDNKEIAPSEQELSELIMKM